MLSKIKNKTVVFYDGDCGFCSWSVQYILKNRKKEVYFMPLQSPNAIEIIEEFGEKIEMDTLFYFENGKLFKKWSAILKISSKLNFTNKTLGFLGHLIPNFIGDKIYDAIASRRKKIMGEKCFLPSQKEKKLFLD